jgi:hypothetical protein
MKFIVAITFVAGFIFLCSTARAQIGPQSSQPNDADDDSGSATLPTPAMPYPYMMPQQPPARRGAQRLGEWVCRDEPPPRGFVVTRGGSMGSCVGTCASRYIERLRDHMVICAGQNIPDGFELLGITTVSDCDCVSGTENGMIIQLKPGYTLQRTGAVRTWTLSRSPSDQDSDETTDTTDMTGE